MSNFDDLVSESRAHNVRQREAGIKKHGAWTFTSSSKGKALDAKLRSKGVKSSIRRAFRSVKKESESSFDEMAGIGEAFEGRMGRQRAEAQRKAAEAAQAHYDRTGEVPEGFQMVFGRIAQKQPALPQTRADMASAAQAIFQPKMSLVPSPRLMSSPRGIAHKKAFFRNLKNGHIKPEELTPEFMDALDQKDRDKVAEILKGTESSVTITTRGESFDEMAGLTEGSAGLARQRRVQLAARKKKFSGPGDVTYDDDFDDDYTKKHISALRDANSRLRAQVADPTGGAYGTYQGSEGSHYPNPTNLEKLKADHRREVLRATREFQQTGKMPEGFKMIFGKLRKVGPTSQTRDFGRWVKGKFSGDPKR